MKNLLNAWRWLSRRCVDCGVKLDGTYARGDVCKKCFDDFNGVTLEGLLGLRKE